jgi:hypothetical protein
MFLRAITFPMAIEQPLVLDLIPVGLAILFDTRTERGERPREEDRPSALGVEYPYPAVDVVGTGSLLLRALMMPIDSPHPAI